MAQRLVRTLCKDCKTETEISAADKKTIDTVLATITDKTYLDGVQTTKIWKAVGCDKCHNTGYRGRIGIFEAIITDANIENVIEMNPSEREIKKAAESQNMLDMTQDGVLKVLAGTTTLDELGRVVDMPVF
jgi:type II secretory ATPase GspE/PulE/Tfp pilus assembly ATPase PilB-like protein